MSGEFSSFGEWELMKKLGAGGYGEVILWKHRSTKEQIVTKRCIRERNAMHADEVHKLQERWLREYKWMQDVSSEFIVRGIKLTDTDFVAYLESQHGLWRPLPVIVMEYCNGGDLRKQLRRVSNWNGLSELEVRQVMHALRHAVEYLHRECKIEHRDLKPENIVIHDTGRKILYKLTDFGLGCVAHDETTKASIVGTSNYMAPEVVTMAQYTKTVDYWSLGVIAFELMCGVPPFIPHQTLLNRINQVSEKLDDCIAITEKWATSYDDDDGRAVSNVGNSSNANDNFVFHAHIFPENHISSIFQQKMESWLRLALNFNFRTRGGIATTTTNEHIFSALDEILDTKILTVFCLNTYQYYAYDVSNKGGTRTMQDLLKALEHDTQLGETTTYFLILPTEHPHRQINEKTRPDDLYVEAWLNATPESSNPPAMLYLLSPQSAFQMPSPRISPLIQHSLLLAAPASAASALPLWLQQQLAAQTHFLIANEQQRLTALLCGLHEYALTLEHELFLFESTLNALMERSLYIAGSVRQFGTMVQQAGLLLCQHPKTQSESCMKFIDAWNAKLNALNDRMQALQRTVLQCVKMRHKSALRRIKKQAQRSYCSDTVAADVYQLNQFRRNLGGMRQEGFVAFHLNVLQLCTDAVYACMEKRHQLLTSAQLRDIQTASAEVHLEFRKILQIVDNAQVYLNTLDGELMHASAEFQQQLLQCASAPELTQNAASVKDLSRKMSSLVICESCVEGGQQRKLRSCNDDATTSMFSLDEILQLPPTTQLLEQTNEQINLLESVLSTEDQQSMKQIMQ